MKRITRWAALFVAMMLALVHGPVAAAATLVPLRPGLEIGPRVPPITVPLPELLCMRFPADGGRQETPVQVGSWTITTPPGWDKANIRLDGSLYWAGPLRISLPAPSASVTLDFTVEGYDDLPSKISIVNAQGAVTRQHLIEEEYEGTRRVFRRELTLMADPGHDIQHLDFFGAHLEKVNWGVLSACYKPLAAPDISVAIASPNRVAAGDSVAVDVELINIGGRAAMLDLGTELRRHYLDIVLSGRAELPAPPQPYSEKYANGVRLKTVGPRHDSITVGYPVAERVTVLIPEDTPTGLYCLGAVFDPLQLVSEATRDNNSACSWVRVEGAEAPPAVPAPVPCTDAPFADVPATHGSCSAITLLVGAGIVNGISPTEYGPNRPVTRAEMAKLLVATLGLPELPGAPAPFSDVAGHWAFTGGWGQQAVAVGMIAGYPNGTFAPDTAVKRSEAVKMAASVVQPVAGGAGPAAGPAVAPGDRFTDVPGSAWYHDWVATALQAELLGDAAPYSLFTGARFAGEQAMTRAEAAQLLANLFTFRSR